MKHGQRAGAASGALAGWSVVITRPVGAALSWRRRIAAAGATPVVLPGLAIRAMADAARVRAQWQAAAATELCIFTSPAAVDHAWRLWPVWPAVPLMAVGQATAARMQRRGAGGVIVPSGRQDSEGLLALPQLQSLQGRRISVVTGVGGRGWLQAELRRRGATVQDIEVYARVAPRLDRRHFAAVQALPRRAILLISSAEAMACLQARLPAAAWQRLLDCALVVSSPRLEQRAAEAGFRDRCCARSALLPAMLAAAEELAYRKGCL